MRSRRELLLLIVAVAGCGSVELPDRPPSRLRVGEDVTAAVLSASGSYAALEAALVADLALERTRPPGSRPPLRGAPSGGNVLVALEKVRRDTPGMEGSVRESFETEVESKLRQGMVPGTLSSGLQAARKLLEPSVENARLALSNEKVRRPFDVERERDPLTRSYSSGFLPESGVGFILAALDALARGDTLEGARLALDLWRFQDDISRDERLARDRFGFSLSGWEPAASMAGVVLDTSGAPAADVVVTAFVKEHASSSLHETAHVTTDEHGVFALDSLAHDRYLLFFHTRDDALEDASVWVDAPAPHQRIALASAGSLAVSVNVPDDESSLEAMRCHASCLGGVNVGLELEQSHR